MATKKKIVKKPAPKKPVKKPAKLANDFEVLAFALNRIGVEYESWEIRYDVDAVGREVPMDPPGVNIVVNSSDKDNYVEFFFDGNGRLLTTTFQS